MDKELILDKYQIKFSVRECQGTYSIEYVPYSTTSNVDH